MNKQKGSSSIWIVIWLALFVGYVLNVIHAIAHISEPLTGLEVLRFVGFLAFPLGAALGYFA